VCKFLTYKWGIRKLITILVTLITVVVFCQSPKVYKYDPITGLWKVANTDESQIVVFPLPQNAFSNSPVSFQIQGTIVIEPTEVSQKTSIDQPTKSGQWYYYIEYVIKNSSDRSYFGIIAAQNYNIGTTIVWNDANNLYVGFELEDGWFATNSHLNITDQLPTGNQIPGQFPYKTVHNPPVSQYLYSVSHSYEVGKKIYTLLHISVTRNGNSETAWAGGEPPSKMCVTISNDKALWYLRKPGAYAANVYQITVEASRQVAITFSNFDNLQPQGGIGVEKIDVRYALSRDFPDTFDWISAPDLNNKSVIVSSGLTSLNLYQLVNLHTQSSGIYTNVGTITFTLQNTKAYIDSTGRSGKN